MAPGFSRRGIAISSPVAAGVSPASAETFAAATVASTEDRYALGWNLPMYCYQRRFLRLDFFLGNFLRLVLAKSRNCFSLIELAICRDGPLSDDLERFPRLAASAAPAAICCFLDLAGMKNLSRLEPKTDLSICELCRTTIKLAMPPQEISRHSSQHD